MKKTVTKTVEVTCCDFCGDETEHSKTCALCGKEGCGKEGYGAHFVHAIEVYTYGQHSNRQDLPICRECDHLEGLEEFIKAKRAEGEGAQ